jgi:plastocyanin
MRVPIGIVSILREVTIAFCYTRAEMTDRAAIRDPWQALNGRSSSTSHIIFGFVLASCLLVVAGCSQSAAAPSQSTTAAPASAPIGGTAASASPKATPEFNSTMASATSAPAGAVTIELSGPPPHYVPAGVSATAGDVTFFLTNRSVGAHTLAIGHGPLEMVGEFVRNTPVAASSAVNIGKSATFTVYGLPAGTYAIWCTISNHAFEGMRGTLTVTP